MAVEKPRSAASRITGIFGCSAGIISANASNEPRTVSTASNSGSLSSWLSLLYANGWPFIKVSKLIKSPKTRPLFPRTNSGTSGFFFCGIMDEPVQKRSGICTKRNCADVHKIISSLIRDKCIIISDAALVNSMAKSRSDTASSEFSETPSKPNNSAVYARLMG